MKHTEFCQFLHILFLTRQRIQGNLSNQHYSYYFYVTTHVFLFILCMYISTAALLLGNEGEISCIQSWTWFYCTQDKQCPRRHVSMWLKDWHCQLESQTFLNSLNIVIMHQCFKGFNTAFTLSLLSLLSLVPCLKQTTFPLSFVILYFKELERSFWRTMYNYINVLIFRWNKTFSKR